MLDLLLRGGGIIFRSSGGVTQCFLPVAFRP